MSRRLLPLSIAVGIATSVLPIAALATPAHAAVDSTTVTVELTPSSSTGLTRLARASWRPTSARQAALRAAAPSARTRAQVEQELRSAGLRVERSNDFSVTATGPRDVIDSLFPPTADGRSTSTPGTTAAVTASDGRGRLHPALAPVTGAVARQLYDAPAPTNVSVSSAPILATVQFSGWRSSDLTTFASGHGYSDPVADGQFQAVSVDGADPATVDGSGGETEVALDQEAILDTAPQLRQRAYFAPNSVFGEVDALNRIATDATGGLPILAVSISWGDCEADQPSVNALHTAITNVLAAGVTVFAAAGDSGAFDCLPMTGSNAAAVDYPASDPLVIGVGGTTTDATSPTAPAEQVWWSAQAGNGGGGGLSTLFSRPSYQSGISISARGVPDISADADPASGFIVVADGSGMQVGGTSLASPLAAATFGNMLAAHGLTAGIGDIHGGLYSAPAAQLRDVTLGSNGLYSAGPGYDLASGLGAPLWSALAATLLPSTTTTPPPGSSPQPAPPPATALTVTAPGVSTSRTIPVTVTAPSGTSYIGWAAGTGSLPAGCTAVSSPSVPTAVTAAADGSTTVWVQAFTAPAACATASASTYVDSVAPTATVRIRRSPATSSQLAVTWSGSDRSPSSGIIAYIVRVTHRGSSTADYAATTATPAVMLTGTPGRRYTATVIAVDAAGNRSRVAAATTTIPLDDRRFAVSRGWLRSKLLGAYDHTFTSTRFRGATATMLATGRTFVLLAQRCRGCGSVAVYVDGRHARTLSLGASHTMNLAGFTVAHFAGSGTHRITVRALGGTVRLDGLIAT